MNKQMSVSMRLGLGFFVILALMVAVAVVSALKVDVIDRSMSQISSQAGLETTLCDQLPWQRARPRDCRARRRQCC